MRWMKWNCGIRTVPIALLACAIAAPAAGPGDDARNAGGSRQGRQGRVVFVD